MSYLSRLASLSIDPYPYADYNETLRSESTRELLHQMEQETIVLLENHGVLLGVVELEERVRDVQRRIECYILQVEESVNAE